MGEITIEHYGYSTYELSRRAAVLRAQVSASPFYLNDLDDKFAEVYLSYDRASRVTPLGVALHSGLAMAPASPFLLAWVAATRQNKSGNVFAPEDR